MQVTDEDKEKVARVIELKRRLAKLRRELESALSAHGGWPGKLIRLEGSSLDASSLPPGAQEKYRLYQQALAELKELRSSLSPELRNLVDPQIVC